jgi:hypothetical protein
MIAKKLLRKGCMAYLVHIINSEKGGMELNNLYMVREFSDVFLEELPGLPLERKVKVAIDVCEYNPYNLVTLQDDTNRNGKTKDLVARIVGQKVYMP